MLKYIPYSLICIFLIVSCTTHADGDDHDHSGTGKLSEEETQLFTTEIKPFIESKCSPCHTTGSQTHFLKGTTVKSHIDDIIRRVELSPNQTGFMPKNGSQLSADEIAKIKSWKSTFDKFK